MGKNKEIFIENPPYEEWNKNSIGQLSMLNIFIRDPVETNFNPWLE